SVAWDMQKHVPPEECASADPKVTATLLFNACDPSRRSLRAEDKLQPEERIFSMKAIRFLVLLLLTTVSFAALPARADPYSWSNLQSDIAGAALHTDRDLVNPWGMAASSGGTIWVADNGTGVSTL